MITPPDVSLIFVMACFWVVFFVVSTQIVKPLARILDAREHEAGVARRRLDEAQSALEAAIARSERDLAAASAEATRERAALRAAGEQARRAHLEAAREQASSRLGKLGTELDSAALEARDALRGGAEAIARELAGRLLGRELRA